MSGTNTWKPTDVTEEVIRHTKHHADCSFCNEIESRDKALKSGSKAELRKQLEYFSEQYWYTSDDLDWHKGVADGSWPHAIEILERWLKNAKS